LQPVHVVVAVHESDYGTSRRFAAVQMIVGYWGHSGLSQAARPAAFMS
jgi:hypothetical protein